MWSRRVERRERRVRLTNERFGAAPRATTTESVPRAVSTTTAASRPSTGDFAKFAQVCQKLMCVARHHTVRNRVYPVPVPCLGRCSLRRSRTSRVRATKRSVQLRHDGLDGLTHTTLVAPPPRCRCRQRNFRTRLRPADATLRCHNKRRRGFACAAAAAGGFDADLGSCSRRTALSSYDCQPKLSRPHV